jgi:hypothetical protein
MYSFCDGSFCDWVIFDGFFCDGSCCNGLIRGFFHIVGPIRYYLTALYLKLAGPNDVTGRLFPVFLALCFLQSDCWSHKVI